MFVEGLAITLPCQRRSTKCSYQRGIHAGKKEEHLVLNRPYALLQTLDFVWSTRIGFHAWMLKKM